LAGTSKGLNARHARNGTAEKEKKTYAAMHTHIQIKYITGIIMTT